MKNKKVSLELNKETVQVLERNELNNVQGGVADSSPVCAVTASIILTTSIIAHTVDMSYYACVPKEGTTNTTKGSEVEIYGGCMLCEVEID